MKLIKKLSKLNAPLVKNTSWMMLSELMARSSRLVTVIALAAALPVSAYGTAMLALVCHDIFRVFTRFGFGSKVIQCDEKDLARISANVNALNWMICLLVAALQIVFSEFVGYFYNNDTLAELLRIMACSYLLYPLVAMKVFLTQRQNNMRSFGLFSGFSIGAENLSTALFVLAGFGLYAVAIAKVVAAIVWVVCFSRLQVKSYRMNLDCKTIKEISGFSSIVLLSELLKMLRQQADMLIAGRLLAPELFGIYGFAKSAGVGLSQSLSAAYLNSLYPHLAHQCRENGLRQAINAALKISCCITAIFVLQAIFAPIYMDILFDRSWANSAIVVSILCLSAVPSLLTDTIALSFRVEGKPIKEAFLIAICVISSCYVLLALNPSTPISFAITFTSASCLWILAAVIIHSYSHLQFKSRQLQC